LVLIALVEWGQSAELLPMEHHHNVTRDSEAKSAIIAMFCLRVFETMRMMGHVHAHVQRVFFRRI